MINSIWYIGYYNNIPLCVSSKKKAVKSYLIDNRKLSPDQYVIEESHRDPTGSDCELIKYCDRYVTTLEYRIIIRDFRIFMDNSYNAYENLNDMLNISSSSEDRRVLKSALNIYEDLFNPDNEISDPALIEILKNYFKNHSIINMNMQTYLARLAAYPDYFKVNYTYPDQFL